MSNRPRILLILGSIIGIVLIVLIGLVGYFHFHESSNVTGSTCVTGHSTTTTNVAGHSINVWLTTKDGKNLLTPQSSLKFTSDDQSNASTVIDLDDNQLCQQIDGFGASITDSSAWLMYNKMSASQRDALMTSLFSPGNGIGIDFVRIPMGASDFSVTGAYSYDDLPSGQADLSLSKFSINHDMAYILPILQQSLALNPSIKFMANPWSPPAWMKTNGSMFGQNDGNTGTLIASDYAPLAQYFVKFIQAYQAQGVPIYMISPQNEPQYATSDYPGMVWEAADESNWIKNNLKPALTSAGLNPKILGWDFVWSDTSYAQALLDDPATNSDIEGIAWHCYDGSPSVMTQIHNQYPTKGMYETECSTGWSHAPANAISLLMSSVQNWAKTVELWNIVLDPKDGPHVGGCTGCSGVVTIDQATGEVTYSQDYYQLGHFSKFVLPGAYHIAGDFADKGLQGVGFKNPDGSEVEVVSNNGASAATFNVRLDGTASFTYTLPAGAVVTFKWS
jgi:glucosylceramidase